MESKKEQVVGNFGSCNDNLHLLPSRPKGKWSEREGTIVLTEAGKEANERLQTTSAKLKDIRSLCRVASISVGVLHEGQVVFEENVAVPDSPFIPRPESQHMYTLCSVSKTLVSAALGILVDQGRVRWTDTIGRHLPDFKPSGKVSIRNTATFENILRHSAGLDNPVVSLLGPGGKVIASKDEFMDVLNSTPTERRGETLYNSWTYSNVGYALVALVIEKISGESFAQFVRSRILMPLGMKNTAVTAAQIEESDNLAHSYAQMQDGSWEKLEHEWTNENNTPILAMVGIRSTVMDMLVFCAAVMDAFASETDMDGDKTSNMQQKGHSRSTDFDVLSGIEYNPLKQFSAILNGCYWTRPHNDPIGHVARYHFGWMRVIMPSCMVSWGSWNKTLADNATHKDDQSARDGSILGQRSGERTLYKSTGVGFCGTCSINIFPESRSSVVAFSNGTNCGDAADFCASLLIQELFNLEPKVDILAMVRREVASREHDFESIMTDLKEHSNTSSPEGDPLDYVGEYRGLGTRIIIQNAPNGDGLQLCFNRRSDMVHALEYFAKASGQSPGMPGWKVDGLTGTITRSVF